MITHPRLIRHVIDTGHKAGLPVQEAVRTGGGTNGGVYHVQQGGAPSVVIGQPVRYIHAPCSVAAESDLENGVQLALAVLRSLSEEVLAAL